MIFSIDNTLFSSQDGEILNDLAKFLSLLNEKHQFLDIESILGFILAPDGEYILDRSDFAQNFLSVYDRDKVRTTFFSILQNTAYLTKLHIKYLTKIKIGLAPSELNPNVALKVINTPSKVVLENTRDFDFIKGIAEKYSNHLVRKSIYKLIQFAINEHNLIVDPAGGQGDIKTRIKELSENHYKDSYQYKIAIVFDSDRQNNTTTSINSSVKPILKYLKGREITDYNDAHYDTSDYIVWHMFYKREVENYLPIAILISDAIPTDKQSKLMKFSNDELDFLDYDFFLTGEGIDIKNNFPKLFLKPFAWGLLEQRCEHHKVKVELPNNTLTDVTEIEELLLKLAKLI